MSERKLVLALETSCDETAVAVVRRDEVLASEVSSQIKIHQPYGGVVPELASRNHIVSVRPLVYAALRTSRIELSAIDAFAATAGPGLASSLLVGNTFAKALAVSTGKPFLAINHMEGHLLSPFLSERCEPCPCVALIVSGGHTMIVEMAGVGDYRVLGRTRDDAAGEAFDKVGKMLGLPYPGGPEIDRSAKSGDSNAYDFPRSMLNSGDFDFSFSGLKTSVLYKLPDAKGHPDWLANLCASFQEAVIDVLVEKVVAAARETARQCIAVSGGVACNSRLREKISARCEREGLRLLLPAPSLTTDNAAMIGYVACLKLARGVTSDLTEDVNPNLALA